MAWSGGRAPPGKIRAGLAQDLVGLAQFAHLTLKCLDPLLLCARRPGPKAWSRSAWRTQWRSVSREQPILAAIDRIALHPVRSWSLRESRRGSVLGITIYSHRDLETLLKGFNQAYNRRRQRVLKGASPEQVVQRRLAAEPKLANRRAKPPDPHALPDALQVVATPWRSRIRTASPRRPRRSPPPTTAADKVISKGSTPSHLRIPTSALATWARIDLDIRVPD